MREVLFRGKRLNDEENEWAYGSYVKQYDCDMIYFPTAESDGFDYAHIIPETVGQYTGLKANGKKIFEGDILQIITGSGWTCPKGTKVYYEVVFTEFNPENASWSEYIGYMAKMKSGALRSLEGVIRRYGAVVIGNIHDNPELLKGE